MVTETYLTARYAETDQMGIIHHSNYAIWFEAGRMDFLRKAGISNVEVEKNGYLLPLSKIDCSFKRPAKYDDQIVVETRIKRMTCVRMEFEYKVFNGSDSRLLAHGTTIHAWTDKELTPVNIEKNMPQAYSLLKETM